MQESWNRQVVLAISTMKEFEAFLESDFPWGVLMEFHIALLHLELLRGISADEAGCEFACQRLGADGIISTRPKVVETAKKNKKLAVFRLFLIDSRSLSRGIALCRSLEPDYVELLPGIACGILPEIQKQIRMPIMCGGLLRSAEQIKACFQAGACAVTISDRQAAYTYRKEQQEG